MTSAVKVSDYIGITVPLITFIGMWPNTPLLSFVVVAFIGLVLLPLLELCLGRFKLYSFDVVATLKNEAHQSPTEAVLIPLYIVVAMHVINVAFGIYCVTYSPGGVYWLPYALLVGFSAGTTLCAAHELYHSGKSMQVFMGRLAFILCCWGHDEVHHLYIHHRDDTACLPNDGVIAHRNQSLYAYIWQMIVVTFNKSWKTQRDLLKSQGRFVYGIHNFVMVSTLLSILVIVALGWFFGLYAVLFFLIQSCISIFMFGLATYSQHYGLVRRKKADGSFEDFTLMNTWSCNSWLGNKLYFNLFKHNHHHLFAFCPYDQLEMIENSPMLNNGIYMVLMISLIPPLWYKYMNPKVDEVLAKRDAMDKQGLS